MKNAMTKTKHSFQVKFTKAALKSWIPITGWVKRI